MGDLISRQAVIDIIQGELSLNTSYDANISCFSIRKCVSELPTAYDVEKVLQELDRQEKKYTEDYLEKDRNLGAMIATSEAIEIVKRGGAE